MKKPSLKNDEWIWCCEADEMFVVPKGTTADLAFLTSCGIACWPAFHWITYMIGEHPWEMRDQESNN